MTEILVLCTWWEPNYWETDKEAPYPQKSIKPVEHLKSRTPIPAVGVYTKGRGRDYTNRPPCFLIIKSISENEKGEPLFDFHYLSQMPGLRSADLLSEIRKRDLFFSVSDEEALVALEKLGVEPPSDWLKLLEVKALVTQSWLNWIGEHFRDTLQTISNDAYEDRIAEIFSAIGFEVKQLGHKKEGEYPDGIAFSKDYAIVYDCKNRVDYFINANDKRAMTKYVQHMKRRIKEQREIEETHFAFVAHSYGRVENVSHIERETSTKGLLLTSESLLYLLFKKLKLGRSFLLADFEDLISNQVVTKERVDTVYGK
jgi:hypothetical protein